jgi:hypothetical protein
VPMLADEGTYIASESSFSRVLRAAGQVRHRGRSKTPQRMRPPSTHVATAPPSCHASCRLDRTVTLRGTEEMTWLGTERSLSSVR